MSDLFEKISTIIDDINEIIGNVVSWAAIAMVLVAFIVVVMRYIFGVGSIFLQESITYFHACLFMIGSAYTLLHNGHVRVDIIYRESSDIKKSIIDLLGVTFFLIPSCIIIWQTSIGYVLLSWSVFEGSAETSGIQAVFLLKTCIWIFAISMILQGLSLIIRSLRVIRDSSNGEPVTHQSGAL